METNLFDLATRQNKEEIEFYLENVTTDEFVNDVKNLLKGSIAKKTIEQTIDKLQKLL